MSEDIRTNFAGMQLGPVAFSTFIDLIIVFISSVLAGGKTNFFSKLKSSLVFSTLG